MGLSWSSLDPTGDNFLNLGKKGGRIAGGILTGGFSETARPDPFGAGRNTAFAKGLGGSITGAATGAATGFFVGGPYGAVAGGILGGIGGGVAGLTGASNNFTPIGTLKNVGIGVGAGVVGGYGAGYFAAPAAKGAVTAGVGGVTSASGGTLAPGAAVAGTGAATAGSTAAGTAGTLGALVIGSLLQRPGGQPGGSGLGDISVVSPGSGPGNLGPSNPPIVYPGVGDGFGSSAFPGGADRGSTVLQQATSPMGLVLIAAGAILFYFFAKTKHG